MSVPVILVSLHCIVGINCHVYCHDWHVLFIVLASTIDCLCFLTGCLLG